MARASCLNILLVEDNPADIRLTREAFKDAQIETSIRAFHDGEAAISYLRRMPPYEDAQVPDLILLDLNLPRMNGRQVLAALKVDPELRRIPIVILSCSRSRDDILSAYDNHANCYIVKPVGFEEFLEVTKAIEEFWLSLVSLPSFPGEHTTAVA